MRRWPLEPNYAGHLDPPKAETPIRPPTEAILYRIRGCLRWRNKGNRSDRPNRVRRARGEARHEIPPSTILTEVKCTMWVVLSRARQPAACSLHQRNLPSLVGCRHPRDRCPGISCVSPFFARIRKTARSLLLRLPKLVTACSSCDLSASRVSSLCSYNRR